MFEREKEIVRQYIELLQGKGGDVNAGMDRLLARNLSWKILGSTPLSGTHVGPEGILKMFGLCYSGDGRPNSTNQGLDPDCPADLTLNDLVALEDGRILTLLTSKSKGRNGVPYVGEYVWLLQVKDDKIVEALEYCDTLCVETAIFDKKLVPAEKLPAGL